MCQHRINRASGPVRSVFSVIGAVSLIACGEGPPDIPVHEEHLPVNGTDIFVKRMGQGDPLVIVHGGPVLEHGYFLPHLEPLAETSELIFFDQRLSGRSAGQVDSASVRLRTLVDDIEALRQALDLGRINLLGHSWGGLLAMRYAIENPQWLRSLVLVSSMAASSELWQQEETLLSERRTDEDRAEFESIRASEEFAAGNPAAIADMIRASFTVQFADRSKIDGLELFVPDDYGERSRQFGYLMGDLTDFDFHEELRSVSARTLIIYGAVEPSAELSGLALRDHITDSELVLVEDAGHFPFIEQPAEFLEALQNFLKVEPERKD